MQVCLVSDDWRAVNTRAYQHFKLSEGWHKHATSRRYFCLLREFSSANLSTFKGLFFLFICPYFDAYRNFFLAADSRWLIADDRTQVVGVSCHAEVREVNRRRNDACKRSENNLVHCTFASLFPRGEAFLRTGDVIEKKVHVLIPEPEQKRVHCLVRACFSQRFTSPVSFV